MVKNKNINPENGFFSEDEIDLRDYIRAVIKKKKLILLIVTVAVSLVLLIDFLKPRLYTATALVRPGVVPGSVIKLQDLSEETKSDSSLVILADNLGLRETPGKLRDAIVFSESPDNNLIRIAVKYDRPGISIKLCDTISRDLVSKGNMYYEKKRDALYGELRVLEIKIQNIIAAGSKLKIGKPGEAARQTNGLIDPQKAVIKADGILKSVEAEKSVVQQQLSDMRKYEIYSAAGLTEEKSTHSATKDAIAAGMIGLTAGLLSVLLRFSKKSPGTR